MTAKKKPPLSQKKRQSMQLEKLLDMEFQARLVLGGVSMEVGNILRLGQGAVLELDTALTEPLQVWVNDRLIAKAEPVVVNEHFGARITEIASKEERLKDMADVD